MEIRDNRLMGALCKDYGSYPPVNNLLVNGARLPAAIRYKQLIPGSVRFMIKVICIHGHLSKG